MRVSRKAVIALSTVVVILCIGYLLSFFLADRNTEMTDKKIRQIAYQASETDDSVSFTKEKWKELHELNPDFIGYMKFDSGIIEQPIVQTNDNKHYLSHSFDNSWNTCGTIFIDASNQLTDTNLIIYGHNVYYDNTAMFSPLERITDEDFLRNNSTLKIWYEMEEVSYQIIYFYSFDTDDYGIYDYQLRNFVSEEEFDEWIRYVDERNLIESEANIGFGDRFITLQTCRKYDPDHRLIILCKEISRQKYE